MGFRFRGTSVSFCSRGAYANLGLPGTELSYRTRFELAAPSGGGNRTATVPDLRQSLEQEAVELMSAVTAIRNIHELTLAPKTGISWAELEAVYLHSRTSLFQVPAPVRPEKPEYHALSENPAGNKGIVFLGKWFESESAKAERQAGNLRRWRQELIDVKRENPLRQHRYQQRQTTRAEQYSNWKCDAEEHEKRLATTQADARQLFRADAAFFESYLAGVLSETEWPRETLVAFEVKPEISTVLPDVGLAEIEDFPDKIYGVNARGMELTQKAIRENYARHSHGCLFRLVGIVLHTLPFDKVIASGFTQRVSGTTIWRMFISCPANALAARRHRTY